ncbi:MAG: Bax inhibitor-1/YccA family protein [Magnetococcales bacterium]|nr:Bax inhibitor-1/YccA family protein [Magnetococcales bacterium]MBF0322636.1 Bax inhibitor-1/YccA family protein [Magnetococcales bacterium]
MSENPFDNRARAQAHAESGAMPAIDVKDSAVEYLKQVYALLAASLVMAVASGYVGMYTPFAFEHPILLLVIEVGVFFLALKIKNTPTLFLFAAISGFTIGPVIAVYVGSGLSGVVGQAMSLTAAIFVGMTFYAMTTRRDLSMMGTFLFAGLIVLLVGSLLNMFFHSSAMGFALSAAGALIFSLYIAWETQSLKENPWAVKPQEAALSMYLNVINLFLSLLRLLGILGSDD